jgi:hypothetical protein
MTPDDGLSPSSIENPPVTHSGRTGLLPSFLRARARFLPVHACTHVHARRYVLHPLGELTLRNDMSVSEAKKLIYETFAAAAAAAAAPASFSSSGHGASVALAPPPPVPRMRVRDGRDGRLGRVWTFASPAAAERTVKDNAGGGLDTVGDIILQVRTRPRARFSGGPAYGGVGKFSVARCCRSVSTIRTRPGTLFLRRVFPGHLPSASLPAAGAKRRAAASGRTLEGAATAPAAASTQTWLRCVVTLCARG